MPPEATKSARARNADPLPNAPAMTPDPRGTMNWPNRFPDKRIEIAIALSSTGDFFETIDIVNGWPIPSAKPAMIIESARVKELLANILINITIVETSMLAFNT